MGAMSMGQKRQQKNYPTYQQMHGNNKYGQARDWPLSNIRPEGPIETFSEI